MGEEAKHCVMVTSVPSKLRGRKVKHCVMVMSVPSEFHDFSSSSLRKSISWLDNVREANETGLAFSMRKASMISRPWH